MTRKSYKASDTELEILNVLWERGALKIRDVTEALYEKSTTSTYATVQSLLERLESKGLVKRNRSGFAHLFSAKVSRSQFLGRQLKAMADKVCEGSMTPLLMHLAQSVKLTDEEREELLGIIEKSG
jgi:predicted transcriptional regulator